MNEVISLETERADAIYLLNLLDRNSSSMPVDEDIQNAQYELNEIVKEMMENFIAHCSEKDLEINETHYLEYLSTEFLSYRRNRLLQSIQIYHALNTVIQFAENNPDHSLSTKFSNVASKEDVILLRQNIEYDLQSFRESMTDKLSESEIEARTRIILECERDLGKSSYHMTDENMRTIDFSIETLLAYGIGMACDELEFLTAVAVHSQMDQTSEAYIDRKDSLSKKIILLTNMSNSFVSDESTSKNNKKPRFS